MKENNSIQNRRRQRLKGFDYREEKLYFVTCTTHQKIHFFGRIRESKMIYSSPGKIACNQWIWLAKQYPFLEIHYFVVMPNHVHAIIQIYNPHLFHSSSDTPPLRKIKSLSEIMGAYKTTVSKQVHLAGFPDFKWHRSFHDHIIRDERSFDYISNYIVTNPERWETYCFHSAME